MSNFFASIFSFILSLMTFIFTIIAYKKRHDDENKNSLKACLFTAFFTSIMTFIGIPIEKPQIYPKFVATHECMNYAEITIDAPSIFKICYSLDGGAPDDNQIYSGPLVITKSAVITAKCKFLCWESEVVDNAYTIVENIPADSAALITEINKPTSNNEESERINYYLNTEPRESIDVEPSKDVFFLIFFSDINVETEVQKIKIESSRIPNPENLKEPTEQNPIYKYCISDQVNLIKVYCGYNDFDYSRMYFFDDNRQLYFAYIYTENEKHKLYFYSGYLIAYVINDEVIYGYDNCEGRCEFEEFVFKEGNELYKK